jgi:hypothetical protein
MTYIVRVVGYNSFWTGDKTPGKLWSSDIKDAYQFSNEVDAINIMYSGRNMQVVNYRDAMEELFPQPVDWEKLDEEAKRISEKEKSDGFKTIDSEGIYLEPEEFLSPEK